MKKLFAALLMATATLCMAQDGVPFNGLVTDLADKPIKGVRVWVSSKDIYSTTNKQGRFGLTNVNADDTLHVKYKKSYYAFPVQSRKSIKIKLGDQLEPVTLEDNELVNQGYGWVRKRETTGSSTGISGEELVKTGKSNLIEALAGKVPGLTVTYQNGKPRALIRGISTNSSQTDPLFMIDGVAVDNLDFVNVYAIDHVEVLKDASIYGARGGNGAILVTTKKAGNNK